MLDSPVAGGLWLATNHADAGQLQCGQTWAHVARKWLVAIRESLDAVCGWVLCSVLCRPDRLPYLLLDIRFMDNILTRSRAFSGAGGPTKHPAGTRRKPALSPLRVSLENARIRPKTTLPFQLTAVVRKGSTTPISLRTIGTYDFKVRFSFASPLALV